MGQLEGAFREFKQRYPDIELTYNDLVRRHGGGA